MSDTPSSERTLSGQVRVDERISRLAARLEPGEIAVIEASDLDRSSALSLLSQRPLAVLNAAPSLTGRKASLGARLLVDAGIELIDDLGPDLMTLTEGDTIRVVGQEIFRGDELIASGRRRTAADLVGQPGGNNEVIETSIRSFAQGAALAWQGESAMLLDGTGIPRLPELRGRGRAGRPALIVTPGERTAGQLRALRRYVRDFSPAIIAVSEAANQVAILGRKPDVIVGDPSMISEKVLRHGAKLVLLERPDGTIPGVDKASNYGLSYLLVPTAASAVDVAILLADVNGIDQIVVAGQVSGIAEFLDRSTAETASGFFTEARCRNKLVSAEVASSLYRPGISGWQLAFLVLAACCVLAAAVFLTPWGAGQGSQIVDWFGGLWSAPPVGGSGAAFGGYPIA